MSNMLRSFRQKLTYSKKTKLTRDVTHLGHYIYIRVHIQKIESLLKCCHSRIVLRGDAQTHIVTDDTFTRTCIYTDEIKIVANSLTVFDGIDIATILDIHKYQNKIVGNSLTMFNGVDTPVGGLDDHVERDERRL